MNTLERVLNVRDEYGACVIIVDENGWSVAPDTTGQFVSTGATLDEALDNFYADMTQEDESE